MPKQKDLKRIVRERMQRTGESYTAARAQVVRTAKDERDYAAIAGISDDAVRKKTDRDWRGWVKLLDSVGATSKTHKEIARLLVDEHRVDHWWAQTVTVGYERIRGLREKGERRGGGFDVNKSKTIGVPIEELYAAFGARKRAKWLGAARLRIKTATPCKSMRITWEDGTALNVHFWEKGPQKSQVQLQQRGLPDKASADRQREFWSERLGELARVLLAPQKG